MESTVKIAIRNFRKTIYASLINVVGLSAGFVSVLRLLLAFVIATAVSWFALHKWLENFAYKIELGWWIFAISGLVIFVLAMLTIGFQTIRAAQANPVESLRYD